MFRFFFVKRNIYFYFVFLSAYLRTPLWLKKITDNPLSRYTIVAILSAIIIFTFLIYRTSLNGEFLNYDDTNNVSENVLIRHLSLATLPQYFTHSTLYMYTPLTFISYAIDFKLWGQDPWHFKLTNLVLHLLNILLIYIIAIKLLKKQFPAFLVTILFAIQPINADTVSWISARSNLLATFFFLLAMIFYFNYTKKNSPGFYALSIVSFILATLSKNSVLMLPLILLLIDRLLQRKLNFRLIAEKIPFLVISIIMGLIALYFRTDTGSTHSLVHYSLPDRFFMICYSILAYIVKSVIPYHLSEVYEYPAKINGWLPILFYISPVVLAGIIILLSRIRTIRQGILFGVLFFFINIIITQVAQLEDGFMANRYAYLPDFGTYFIIAVVVHHYYSNSAKLKNALLISFIPVLIIYSLMTYRRSQVWVNTSTLFEHAVKKSPGSAFAWNNLGIAKYFKNDVDGALSDYNKAIALNPEYAEAYYNRGLIFYDIHDYNKAMDDYTNAIGMNSNFASCFTARGILEMDVFSKDTLALMDYNKAIAINPELAQAYYNRGILMLRMNDQNNACKDFMIVKQLGYSRADDLIERFCR